MKKDIIGIVGGFGAYATLDFYRRLLEAFSSDNERNYPHILMDNNFTMPSRTRALLYDENILEISKEIQKSISFLRKGGATKIVLPCGTAHYFLNDIFLRAPEIKPFVCNIVSLLGEKLKRQNISCSVIIAAEGSLHKKLYEYSLQSYGVEVISPLSVLDGDVNSVIRLFIESVKQNSISVEVATLFISFTNNLCQRAGKCEMCRDVILGCTEFPFLVKYIQENSMLFPQDVYAQFLLFQFHDPLEVCLEYFVKTIE